MKGTILLAVCCMSLLPQGHYECCLTTSLLALHTADVVSMTGIS